MVSHFHGLFGGTQDADSFRKGGVIKEHRKQDKKKQIASLIADHM